MSGIVSRRIKVLVLEDRESLGEVGQTVEVRPGYARNFLFPQGIASLVTADAMRRVAKSKAQAVARRVERAAALAELAKSLEGVSLTIEERASEEGHLFGSVGAADIAEALRAKGLPVEEKKILLENPIKELGIFNVPVRLDAETTVEVRVWVVEPGA